MIYLSKYTTELHYLVESNFDLGLQDYPLFEFKNIFQGVDYRKQLNDKIIQHFWFREIGFETPIRFKFHLNRKMNEIMTYYNEMYKSIDLQYNPLWNVDMTETYTHTKSATGKTTADGTTLNNSSSTNKREENLSQNSTSNSSNTENQTNTNTNTHNKNSTINDSNTFDNIVVESDTPQSELTDSEIQSYKYASKINHSKNINTKQNVSNDTITDNLSSNGKITNDSNLNGSIKNDNVINDNANSSLNETSNNEINSTDSQTEDYTRKEYGSSAGLSFSHAIQQWRDVMVNIDMMIIEELEELFMQIW